MEPDYAVRGHLHDVFIGVAGGGCFKSRGPQPQIPSLTVQLLSIYRKKNSIQYFYGQINNLVSHCWRAYFNIIPNILLKPTLEMFLSFSITHYPLY